MGTEVGRRPRRAGTDARSRDPFGAAQGRPRRRRPLRPRMGILVEEALTDKIVKRSPPPEKLDRGEKQSDWEVAIAGDLTDKHHDLLERLVELPPRSRGTIWFDSCGGSAYVGISLAGLIRL